jgi:hypothetical protein
MTTIKLSDFDKLILDTVRENLHKVIGDKLSGYDSPLKKMIEDAFKIHDQELRDLVYQSLGMAIKQEDFKIAVKQAFDHKIARCMVEHLSSSVDKAVNAIRSDPTIKARMVLAIEEIINKKV